MRNSKHIVLALAAALVLVACGGGSDPAPAASDPTAGGLATTDTTTSTPAPGPAAPTEPTTGYGYVTNPAGGNYGIQCAKDYATGLIWEGKNPNPAHPQGSGRTYTNFDNMAAQQVRVSTPACPSCVRQPTAGEISASSNAIGYKNAINSTALCGFSDWRLPTTNELIVLGKLSEKLAGFPETVSQTYWANDLSIRDDLGVKVISGADSGNKEYRGDTFGVRLVRSSR